MNKIDIWDKLEKEFYIEGSEYQKAISKGEKIPQFSPEFLFLKKRKNLVRRSSFV